jgi:DNA-binding XRE family transcriptional regulator
LRHLRERFGISIDRMARACGVSPRVIVAHENGDLHLGPRHDEADALRLDAQVRECYAALVRFASDIEQIKGKIVRGGS